MTAIRFTEKRLVMVLLAALFAIVPAMAKGDKGDPKFAATTIDMGVMPENGGPRTVTFEFTNVGNGSMIITGATAQCGCTRPTYSEAPVAPGRKGTVKVTYNPKGRPGAFSKTITVRMAGAKKNKVILKIKGSVKK